MRVALLGDIALFGCCSRPGYFNTIGDYLSSFDYVVGNLETPFSLKRKTFGAKSAYIYASPESSSILKQLNLSAVNLANNHMFDYGEEGYELTKKILAESGIEWFGTEGKELKVELDNNRIAFAGFCCYTTNPILCVKYGDYGVNAYNINKAREILQGFLLEGYLPIFSVHAGIEHVNYPSLEHILAARSLSTVGEFIYYGHHPHVIQGVEVFNGSLISHSLGNFCFDNIYTKASGNKPLIELSDNNRTGMILELTIESNAIVNWEERVIHIGEDSISLLKDSGLLSDYNVELQTCGNHMEQYNIMRNKIITEREDGRQAMRNLSWYVKRLKPRYLNMLLNSRRNRLLFDSNVRALL